MRALRPDAGAQGLEPATLARGKAPRVLLVGSTRRADVRALAARLGQVLATGPFRLACGGTPSVEAVAAEAFHATARAPERVRRVLRAPEGAAFGTVVFADSAEAARGALLHHADAVLLLGGGREAETCAREALARGLPLVALPATGGAAQRLWPEARAQLGQQGVDAGTLAALGSAHGPRAALEALTRALASPAPVRTAPALRLFLSYAHEDRRHRAMLHKHLVLLEREGLVGCWHDGDIHAGREWEQAIRTELHRADVVVLLVSVHFLASGYCTEVEVARAMERHAAGEARVVPVILSAVDWARQPFARLQALPTGARPVKDWPNREKAWADVARGLRRTLEALREERSAAASTAGRAAG